MVIASPFPHGHDVPDRAGRPDPRLRALGAHVRQLREARGLTQEALGERAQLGPRHIARVEAGRGNPTALWLLQLADGLGVVVADLWP